MLRTKKILVFLCTLMCAPHAHARLEICNQTDLVLMAAVGYDTIESRTATEGWWRVYPGFCEVPVDVAMLEGSYYVHVESNPRSTMPNDGFDWGSEKELCVQQNDFRVPEAMNCSSDNDSLKVKFNAVEKNWRNLNRVSIVHPQRRYQTIYRTRIAGIQRLLSIIGYDVGTIDGVIGQKTVEALNEIGTRNQVFGFDIKAMFPILEATIASQQKLDN